MRSSYIVSGGCLIGRAKDSCACDVDWNNESDSKEYGQCYIPLAQGQVLRIKGGRTYMLSLAMPDVE